MITRRSCTNSIIKDIPGRLRLVEFNRKSSIRIVPSFKMIVRIIVIIDLGSEILTKYLVGVLVYVFLLDLQFILTQKYLLKIRLSFFAGIAIHLLGGSLIKKILLQRYIGGKSFQNLLVFSGITPLVIFMYDTYP